MNAYVHTLSYKRNNTLKLTPFSWTLHSEGVIREMLDLIGSSLGSEHFGLSSRTPPLVFKLRTPGSRNAGFNWVFIRIGALWPLITYPLAFKLRTPGSDRHWLALVGSGCLWPALAASGWLWLPPAGSGWLSLALAGSG